MIADLTTEHIRLLQHGIGIDRDTTLTGEPWRNRYAANPDGDATRLLDEMVGMGLVMRGQTIPGGLVMYHATDAGIEAARDAERKARATKGLRVYDVIIRAGEDYPAQTKTVLARSRGAAKWEAIADMVDVGWAMLAALAEVSSVRVRGGARV